MDDEHNSWSPTILQDLSKESNLKCPRPTTTGVYMVQRKFVVALNHSQNKYKYKDAYKHKEKREYMVK